MGARRDVHRYRAFLLLLSAGSVAVLVVAGRASGDVDLPAVWLPALLILFLHAVARRFPLRIGGRNRVEFTACTSLGFALLLAVPVPLAVLALAAAALIPQPHLRRGSWSRRVFEVCRTTLVFATAGWAVTAATTILGLAEVTASWHYLALLLPAGALAYVVDAFLSALAVALEQGASMRTVLHQDRARFDLAAYLLLVGLAPFIVVIVERTILLAPSLLVALVVLHRATGTSATSTHGALHDALTGLPNRRQLEIRLSELISGARGHDQFALLLMDLDRFSEVNEQLGHEVGDELLEEVANRLRRIDGVDLVARIGGDEFAFVIRHGGSPAELLDLGDRMIGQVGRPYVVSDVRVVVGATVGIAVFPEHAIDGPNLLRRADSAMYGAKRDGVSVGLASRVSENGTPGRMSLVGELEEAMRRDELQLEYQPKVCLHSGEIVGVESLLRWHHPEHGLVPPDAFVSTVEHTDLIAPLTRHVLRKALSDVQGWNHSGLNDLPVSVNISTRDLQDVRFPGELSRLLLRHHVAPGLLTLEITETALQVDPERAAQVLAQLRDLGVRLSIDDFGTGYSSLAALRHLPVSELKIDRVFVSAMDEDDAGKAIVRSMVQLAHALQLEVVAEGVENDEVMAELRSFGCDVVQGYIVGRPLPAHLVVAWIAARRDELDAARALPFARAVRELGRTRSRTRVG